MLYSKLNSRAAGGGINRDLYDLALEGDRKSTGIQNTEFDEVQGRLSSDGKWMAFTSNETGRYEVYVRTFPGTERKWRISSQGGSDPQWRGDGKELLFLAGDGKMMSVPMRLAEGAEPAVPVPLFQASLPSYGTASRARKKVRTFACRPPATRTRRVAGRSGFGPARPSAEING